MKWPWVRDFSFVGAVTGFLAPYMVIKDLAYATVAGAGGALTGALLGLFSAALMSTRVRRWPKLVLLPTGFGLGALWGMGAALPTGVATPHFLGLTLLFSGAAGAVQLGWFWLAYCYRRVNLRSTWPVVLLAAALGAGLGYSGYAVLALL